MHWIFARVVFLFLFLLEFTQKVLHTSKEETCVQEVLSKGHCFAFIHIFLNITNLTSSFISFLVPLFNSSCRQILDQEVHRRIQLRIW